MARGTTNWTNDLTDNSEARKTLEKAKKMDIKRDKDGWCFVRINGMTELHVPCDEDGNPTDDGLRRIERMKEYLGIK